MEQKDFTRRMIKFNQTLFNNAFEATVQFQDQVENIGNSMLEQAGWLPEENKKAYDTYKQACKDNRSNLKSYMDEGYRKAEQFFN